MRDQAKTKTLPLWSGGLSTGALSATTSALNTVSLSYSGGESAFARLSRLYDIIRALNSIGQLDKLLNQLVASAANMLEARGGALLLGDSRSGNLRFEVTSGRDAAQLKHKVIPIDERSVEGSVVLLGTPQVVNQVHNSTFLLGQAAPANSRNAGKLICVPLYNSGKIIGVLEVIDKLTGDNFDTDDVKLLETLADAAVIAIENTRRYEDERRQARRLAQTLDELEKTYKATLQALTGLLDMRDDTTHGHSVRVVEFTLRLAREMGITDRGRLKNIERGALLHDVGKIGISDAILRKPSTLDDEEWAQMRRHPELGYETLKSIEFLSEALPIVHCHHERWDGSGYPQGLKGDEIPLEARIFAVADAFDAITSDRPYSQAREHAEAVEVMKSESGKMFDPDVVQAFLRVHSEEWARIRAEAMRKVYHKAHP